MTVCVCVLIIAIIRVVFRARMTLLSPLEVEQRSLALTAHLSLASLVSSLQRSRAWEPLNLPAIVRIPLIQRAQDWLANDSHGKRLHHSTFYQRVLCIPCVA
jgi:hypothetical protein